MKILQRVVGLGILCLGLFLGATSDSAYAAPPSLVISQIQTRNQGQANQELIEIYNDSSEDMDITNWCVRYTSASGSSNRSLFCFEPLNTSIGYRVILPFKSYALLASTNYSGLVSDGTFSAGMSDDGGRVGVYDAQGGVIDALAWGNANHEIAEGIPAPALSGGNSGKVLERKILLEDTLQDTNNNSEDFFVTEPRLLYAAGSLTDVMDYCLNIDGIQENTPEGYNRNEVTGICVLISEMPATVCESIIISEVLPNPAGADAGKEFIELHNPTADDLILQNCFLKTSANSTEFSLDGVKLSSGAYKVFYDSETKLTLPNTGGGTVWLLSDAEDVDEIKYPESLADDVSYAWFGSNGWRLTYALTPSEANLWLASKPCPEGQERSEETGRCRNIPVPKMLADCGPGRYRHPETNRCRNIASAGRTLVPCRADQYRNPETNRCRLIGSGSTLKPCRPDQFRNPETNRCKKIDGGSILKPCKPNQERNPETNRCRKIPEVLSALANPAAIPDNRSKPLGFDYRIWGGLGAMVVGYGLYEYRTDARQFLSRLRSKRLKHKPPG